MKELKLIRGGIAMVDDEDFERMSKGKWYAEKSGNKFYAMRYFYNYEKNRKDHVRMHRELMNLTDPKKVVDHIDGNGLNNQKSNIRICTQAQNRFNSNKRKGNKTGYIGVSLFNNKVFRARILLNGKEHHLGYFKDAKEAALVRDKKCRELHGEFAKLNFPMIH